MKKSAIAHSPATLGSISLPVHAYRATIVLAALGCWSPAQAEIITTVSTNTPQFFGGVTNAPIRAPASTNAVNKLQEVTVVGNLEPERTQVVSSLGTGSYVLSKDQIAAMGQGENAPLNQLLLQAPGVVQDSFGQVHVRDEHANLQYRINDVLLPDGISGFGSELDPRFIEKMQFITGALPAQFGFRTAGVVDLTTKTGLFDPGGEVSMYGGSYDTLKPSFEYGGSKGNLNFFADGSWTHDNIGIENPTPNAGSIHDITDQYRMFSYLSYLLSDTSRLSAILSASYSDFEIPDSPNLAPGLSPSGLPWYTDMPQVGGTNSFSSANLNERQNEQNYYGVISYQKSLEDFNLQVSAFGRNSSVHFTPDSIGDLYFNGVASDVARDLYSGGLQADASYNISESHTLRGGVMSWDEVASADTSTTVFNEVNGAPAGAPYTITQNGVNHGLFYGAYLQDEWKITPKFTLNFGTRFDGISSYIDANQLSPRLNMVYKLGDKTTLHAGYSRYFTPPPLELVRSGAVTVYNGTSNGSVVTQDSPVEAERSHYFDAGVSHKLTPEITVGLDGYYKIAHNQLDDGLFGQTLIVSPFNYRVGSIEGVELTINYTKDGFLTYANVALADGMGKGIDSAQFLFDSNTLAYSQNEYIHLDHDQRITGSFGASYTWKEKRGSTRIYIDAIYGSGLRADEVSSTGEVIVPNGVNLEPYYSINMGVEEIIQTPTKHRWKLRLDVLNITDDVYELRNGTGVGVNAPQYGMRLGFYGSLGYAF